METRDHISNVDIRYFTGTGNSLLVARKLAERLDGATISPISRALGSHALPAENDAAAIGLVFPIYFDRMPRIVRTALAAMSVPAGAYVFAVTTSGEVTGNALVAVDSLLRSRGSRLSYGANLALADNSIILRTPAEETERRFAALDARLDEIADSIVARGTNDVAAQRSGRLAAMGPVNELGFNMLYQAKHRLVDAEKCTRCGLCTRLCPVANISMDDTGVRIGSNCERCFACLNWCPQTAIRFGRIDPAARGQYRCAGIHASDIRRSAEQ